VHRHRRQQLHSHIGLGAPELDRPSPCSAPPMACCRLPWCTPPLLARPPTSCCCCCCCGTAGAGGLSVGGSCSALPPPLVLLLVDGDPEADRSAVASWPAWAQPDAGVAEYEWWHSRQNRHQSHKHHALLSPRQAPRPQSCIASHQVYAAYDTQRPAGLCALRLDPSDPMPSLQSLQAHQA
jgi:hypothetical protein